MELSTNLYFLIELILNFSDEKPISDAVEDMLNSQAPITPIDTPPVNCEKPKRFDEIHIIW